MQAICLLSILAVAFGIRLRHRELELSNPSGECDLSSDAAVVAGSSDWIPDDISVTEHLNTDKRHWIAFVSSDGTRKHFQHTKVHGTAEVDFSPDNLKDANDELFDARRLHPDLLEKMYKFAQHPHEAHAQIFFEGVASVLNHESFLPPKARSFVRELLTDIYEHSPAGVVTFFLAVEKEDPAIWKVLSKDGSDVPVERQIEILSALATLQKGSNIESDDNHAGGCDVARTLFSDVQKFIEFSFKAIYRKIDRTPLKGETNSVPPESKEINKKSDDIVATGADAGAGPDFSDSGEGANSIGVDMDTPKEPVAWSGLVSRNLNIKPVPLVHVSSPSTAKDFFESAIAADRDAETAVSQESSGVELKEEIYFTSDEAIVPDEEWSYEHPSHIPDMATVVKSFKPAASLLFKYF
eukprot:gene164-977_t